MNLFSRHKNSVALAVVLMAQLLALAVQVKRQTPEGPVRLIRLVVVNTVAPFERLLIYSGESVRGVWDNYIDLRGVRATNQRLEAETAQLQLQRAREQEELRQAHRIQALLAFKQNWIDTTVAAQVIGTSGTESSRLLYLDKGSNEGIHAEMPVITPDGVVGKVLAVYGDTSQVLMINDPTSGVGAILTDSRLRGIVKGTPTGGVQLNYIMSDESVKPGEKLVTSGGDRVYPKGLPIGTVTRVSQGRNQSLDIALKPAVNLNHLEEVLVITHQQPRAPDAADAGALSAAEILTRHLPSVPEQPAEAPKPGASPKPGANGGKPGAGSANPEAHAAKPTGGAAANPEAHVAMKPHEKTVKPKMAAKPEAGANPDASIPAKPEVNAAKPPTHAAPQAGGAKPNRAPANELPGDGSDPR